MQPGPDAVADMREVRATLVGAALLLSYLCFVLMTGRVEIAQFASLFATYVTGSFALWFMVGIVGAIAQICWRARKSGRGSFLVDYAANSLRDRWRRDRCVSLIWPPVLFAAMMASFNSFKQMVLPLAGYGFDPLFAKADRLLFFGTDGWRVTHAVFGSAEATAWIDKFYHGWFVPMALGVIICAWLPASTYRLRTQYLLSYMAVWMVLGSLLAFLLPSAGPCFYAQLVGPEPGFDALMQRLNDIQAANGYQLIALRNQAMLLGANGSDHLVMGGGISAMPSVHNGLAILFALAAWKVNRPLGLLLAAYAGMIWIGSVHLGWHYALDGIVAGALTLWIWRVCGKLADRLERPLFPKQAETALA